MKIQRQGKANVQRNDIQPGTVEGVILVNGKPQIERADMPLAFSFDSIEELERFCEAARSRS